MLEKDVKVKKISKTNTKQEMLDAYNELLKQLQEKSKDVLRPEEEIKKKKDKEIIRTANSLSSEGVMEEISSLKLDIGKILAGLSEKLEEEVNKYKRVKDAIDIKEKELAEVYKIEKEAQTLAALLEVQSQKCKEFEAEMQEEKEKLNKEIQKTRIEWEEETKHHGLKNKEKDTEELKKRQREKEDNAYLLKRQQQMEKDKFDDKLKSQEKEFNLKKEEAEKKLADKEKQINEKEQELKNLQKRVDIFPKDIERAVDKAVKETKDQMQSESRNKEELLKKSFEGERNVLTAKIDSFEKTVKEFRDQNTKLSQQLEKAYQKIQEMAVKVVGGVSDFKTILGPQAQSSEQVKK